MVEVLFYIGVLQLTVVFLAIAAGLISLTLFRVSRKNPELVAWKSLMVVLVLFAIVEIVGVLDAFNIWREINYMRHIIPSFVLIFMIIAIIQQIWVTKARACS
ncbi:hypothetical protein HN592_04700 [Candidatus Woesearchaeota archaeon]|jgi:hypothetical protein|nr:hypothetical protein [Candidatus Woesearchaeota archaeon]MBT4368512.1 hypothetical protein [Candidatus Woesearchaeota archaeon]MBT4713001.1 hypothetical protein [Candidatus Woesearchaeota archaeon]MBT6639913.1 hypothetical protein [Candidatus Woesearchaeota archaeon]MBT7134085.1 hypothetical protein [Candidatus Woesearchaeota archaeon]